MLIRAGKPHKSFDYSFQKKAYVEGKLSCKVSERETIISDFLRVSGQIENSVLPSVLAVAIPYDIHVKVMENPLGHFQLCTLHTSSYGAALIGSRKLQLSQASSLF